MKQRIKLAIQKIRQKKIPMRATKREKNFKNRIF